MTILDTVIEMQKQGMTDYEISKNLQTQGIYPREINDALNQAKIKSAVQGQTTSQQMFGQPSITDTNQIGQYPQMDQQNTMQPFGLQQQNPIQASYPPQPSSQGIYSSQQIPSQDQYNSNPPQPSIMQSYGQEQQTYPQETYSQEYVQEPYTNQEYYPDQQYSGTEGYASSETITEIAEQVVNEKFKEYHKKTGDIAMFKTMIQDKVNIIEQRLKRIEDNFDKLQQAIVQKVGEFGENTTLIRRDLENLHNTTSKLMNPLIDTYRELEKQKHKR